MILITLVMEALVSLIAALASDFRTLLESNKSLDPGPEYLDSFPAVRTF